MKWAHVTDDGLLDWTSDIEQEGLVQVRLPAINQRDKLYYKDGKIKIERAMREREEFSEIIAPDIVIPTFNMIFNMIKEPPAEGVGRKVQGGVTVLIPCYNKAAWVKETVQSALAQTQSPEEIKVLLMDSGSRAMKEELEGLSPIVQCECAERMDVCAARNYLAEQCKTEFFTFLDADDILQEDFFEKTLSDEADFILTPFSNYGDGKREEALHPLQEGNLTGVYRKAAFFGLGGLSEVFAGMGHEDTDFLFSIFESDYVFRAEKGTRYFIRREYNDEAWKASSFVLSDSFINQEKDARKLLLKRHESFFVACIASSWDNDLSIRFNDAKKRLLSRYVTTKQEELALYLHYYMKQQVTKAKSEEEKEKERWGESFRFIFSRGTADLYEALPGRDFEEAAEFLGDFEGWRFVNCEPAEEEKAFIAERMKGKVFDVLFLEKPEKDEPTFTDILLGHDAALVNASLEFENESGAKFCAEALQKYFCAFFPLYKKESTEFSANNLELVSALADAESSVPDEESIVKAYEAEWGNPMMPQVVTFELHKECNRNCPYCLQAKARSLPVYDDEEMYARFNAMLARVEKLTRGNIIPQIMGGEPTLLSDELIHKILKRLSGYPQIFVLTNHDIRTSAWEDDPRVRFYTHVVDWQNAGKLPIMQNETFMIVLTHDDMDYLEGFMKKNKGQQISIVEYVGDDETMKLTAADRERLLELERRYPSVDNLRNKEIEIFGDMSDEERWEYCRSKKRFVWEADCSTMTIIPCCGAGKDGIPYEEFDGQAPTSEFCSGCQQWSLWLRGGD